MFRSWLARWLAAALSVSLLLALTAPFARAQETPDYISDVTFISATVDLDTGVAALTFTVTCLIDLQFLRSRAGLTQRDAASFQTFGGVGESCTAGEVKSFTIVFGRQQGRFYPGPATLRGWVEALPECCLGPSDIESLPVDRVILRPA